MLSHKLYSSFVLFTGNVYSGPTLHYQKYDVHLTNVFFVLKEDFFPVMKTGN